MWKVDPQNTLSVSHCYMKLYGLKGHLKTALRIYPLAKNLNILVVRVNTIERKEKVRFESLAEKVAKKKKNEKRLASLKLYLVQSQRHVKSLFPLSLGVNFFPTITILSSQSVKRKFNIQIESYSSGKMRIMESS